jgi:AhpC/TSA family
LASSTLDALNELGLDPQAPHKPIEVSGDDHVRFAGLNSLDRLVEPRSALKVRPAAHIKLVDCAQQEELVALARVLDPLALLVGTDERFPVPLPLLADVDKAVAKSYSAFSARLGTKRAVIVIDEQGVVRHRHDHLLGLDYQSVDELKSTLDALPTPATP